MRRIKTHKKYIEIEKIPYSHKVLTSMTLFCYKVSFQDWHTFLNDWKAEYLAIEIIFLASQLKNNTKVMSTTLNMLEYTRLTCLIIDPSFGSLIHWIFDQIWLHPSLPWPMTIIMAIMVMMMIVSISEPKLWNGVLEYLLVIGNRWQDGSTLII